MTVTVSQIAFNARAKGKDSLIEEPVFFAHNENSPPATWIALTLIGQPDGRFLIAQHNRDIPAASQHEVYAHDAPAAIKNLGLPDATPIAAQCLLGPFTQNQTNAILRIAEGVAGARHYTALAADEARRLGEGFSATPAAGADIKAAPSP